MMRYAYIFPPIAALVAVAAIINDDSIQAYVFGAMAWATHMFLVIVDISLERERLERVKAIGAVIAGSPDEKVIQLVVDNSGNGDDN